MPRTLILTALLRRSIARAAATVGAVAAILAAFQVLLVLVATAFQRTRSFSLISTLMPPSLQQSFGPEALMFASFNGIVTFGYFHPIVVLVVIQTGIYLATEPAGEVEWGLFDLQLARPVARHLVITRSLVLAFGLTAAIVCSMALATWAGLATIAAAGAPWPPPATVASLGAHLLLLAWGFAAAGLAAASVARRRGTAFAVVAVAAVFLYMLNLVADVWQPAARIRWVLPYHYYSGFAVASGTAPVAWDLGVLAIPVVAFTALAYWQFNRRDL